MDPVDPIGVILKVFPEPAGFSHTVGTGIGEVNEVLVAGIRVVNNGSNFHARPNRFDFRLSQAGPF